MRFAVLFVVLLTALPAAEKTAPRPAGNVAPYYPSPMSIVSQMLDAAEIEPGELHYDLGSGDGRIVVVAARDYGTQSVGFEIDPKLVKSSRDWIEREELQDSATIEARDLFLADFSKPDLITVYLLPRALEKLRPLLEEQMKPGSRVVSHDFSIPGWDPDETLTSDEEADIDGLLHTIYVYRRGEE